jgi:hypothetical protein
MQFLISVIDDGQAADAGRTDSATEAEMAAVDVFNDTLRSEGHWVFAAGITAPDAATLIDNRGDLGESVPGTLAKSPEYIAGFWIIEVADSDEALRLARDGSKACNRRVEVRPLL